MPELQAISTGQLKRHLVGLGDLLTAQATLTGLTQDYLARQAIVASQQTIQERTGVPFFKYRYCTPTIALQESLTLGTNYDQEVEPQDYQMDNWRLKTGKTRFRYAPIREVTLFRLTLTGDSGKILDVPSEWINIKPWNGVIHVIPFSSATITFTTYYSLVGVLALNRAALASGLVPCLVQSRYTAGIVAIPAVLGDWDPEDEVLLTNPWGVGPVLEYQDAIGQHAAAKIMRECARELDKGGLQVSFDGMSQSVNAQVLEQAAQGAEQRAISWADSFRQNRRGVRIAWA